METLLVKSSSDHQFPSPYKQIKNSRKKNTRSFVLRPRENIHGGLLLAPPPPPPAYTYHPSLSFHTYNYQQQPQQPPLLPLPLPIPKPQLSRAVTCPPINRKPTRPRDQSLTPKKSKKPTKRDEGILPKPADSEKTSQTIFVGSVNPLGPDPNELPTDVAKVFSAGVVTIRDLEKFSGSVFAVSPPPSSLPLPKFSLRPKQISCKAEAAAEIDTGATDDLRRLLRIR